jgi:hypothetical protein
MEFQGFPWLASNPYAYPLLEAAHIVGIGLLFGNLVLLELRVWGRATDIPPLALQRATVRVALVGFGLAFLTGTTMFLSQPQELLGNDAFLLKLGLIAAAGFNALVFHRRGGIARADAVGRAQTLLSMLLWVGVIIAGRWIGYL